MKIFALLICIFALVSSAVVPKDDVCALEHSKTVDADGNSCFAYIESWSYRADTNNCVRFIYGGCNGNKNRFDTLEECELRCKK